MIKIRKNEDRGKSQLEWLKSFHTFSFAEYYDSEFMGLGNLRVINEDTVQPGFGFGEHPHKNMEIISYVIEGALTHEDSIGNFSVIKPGEIQRMSAGSGVRHSEYNPSTKEILHFLQVWITPGEQGLLPSYEQKVIPKEKNKLILIGSPAGGEHAVKINQDVNLFVAYTEENQSIKYEFEKNGKGWLQLVKGKITLNDQLLSAGDGAAIVDENDIQITSVENAEFLLFDLG